MHAAKKASEEGGEQGEFDHCFFIREGREGARRKAKEKSLGFYEASPFQFAVGAEIDQQANG